MPHHSPVFEMKTLALESNLFLSPLAGYTNLPFRLVIREVGGVDLCTTDLVNARSIIERNPKALKLIETNDNDRPLAVQLFGAVPEEMRDAALQLESLGISAIDINMGCPVRKVVKTGGGSAMMTELDKTHELVRGMVEALKIPVTAKKAAAQHYDAILCLGAVIKGETTHDRYINQQVSHSLGQLSMETEKPVAFGLLTCNNLEQACLLYTSDAADE